MDNRAAMGMGRVAVPNPPSLSASPSAMAKKRKARSPLPPQGPPRPARESSLDKKLALNYMDQAVHQGYMSEVHTRYMKDEGFGDFASLSWSDEQFSLTVLCQFIKNFDAAKESTMVNGPVTHS